MLVEPGETCHSMSLVVGFRLGHSPVAVVVTARGNRSYNCPLIKPPLRTVTGWGKDDSGCGVLAFKAQSLPTHIFLGGSGHFMDLTGLDSQSEGFGNPTPQIPPLNRKPKTLNDSSRV